MPAIYQAVESFRALGVQVLSPADARVVDAIEDFLFVESDRLRSVRLVEDRHLESINASDFLWVVAPDGYTGPATCQEIGFALSAGVPIFSQAPIVDITVGEYVQKVDSPADAVGRVVRGGHRKRDDGHLLLDPEGSTERVIRAVEGLKPVITGQQGDLRGDAERKFAEVQTELSRTFGIGSRRRMSGGGR
ncbi:MAG: hypothetical protein EON59_04870 [Alphaproteobacteria bacterium]|nr:MAG: hypothetical protein EON59_04870 [Alphaproteobacteria bacterium]